MKRRTKKILTTMRLPENGRANGNILQDIDFQLIENLPVGVALIEMCMLEDARTWRVTAANEIARQAIGGSLLDFLLSRTASFPFRKNMEEEYLQILHRRRPKGLRWIIVDAGGVRKTYSVTAFAVPPRHIGLLMQDESIHSETRKALADQKNIQAEVSRAIETFLWRGDPQTLQTTWVSPEAQEVLGYWPEHWVNIPSFWINHIHPDDREMVSRLAMKANAKEERFDYRMHAANGEEKWFQAVIRKIEKPTGGMELAGVMVDITGRKMAEEQAHDLSGKLLRAQDEGQRRVARELHDSLGQYLSLLGMNVGRLSRTVKGLDDEQRRVFGEMADLVEMCCREVRTMSYLMHPPMLDEVGLGPALDWYVKGFSERSGIEVEIQVQDALKHLPERVEMAFFRIAQEGLTNIYRHSGSQKACIRVRQDRDGLMLEIVDYGKGITANGNAEDATDASARGVGIRGMRERMRELGGSLEIMSGESGTAVRARIPKKAIAAFASENTEEQAQPTVEAMKSAG
jgi:two-component system, NarL family, sensor kinase